MAEGTSLLERRGTFCSCPDFSQHARATVALDANSAPIESKGLPSPCSSGNDFLSDMNSLSFWETPSLAPNWHGPVHNPSPAVPFVNWVCRIFEQATDCLAGRMLIIATDRRLFRCPEEAVDMWLARWWAATVCPTLTAAQCCTLAHRVTPSSHRWLEYRERFYSEVAHAERVYMGQNWDKISIMVANNVAAHRQIEEIIENGAAVEDPDFTVFGARKRNDDGFRMLNDTTFQREASVRQDGYLLLLFLAPYCGGCASLRQEMRDSFPTLHPCTPMGEWGEEGEGEVEGSAPSRYRFANLHPFDIMEVNGAGSLELSTRFGVVEFPTAILYDCALQRAAGVKRINLSKLTSLSSDDLLKDTPHGPDSPPPVLPSPRHGDARSPSLPDSNSSTPPQSPHAQPVGYARILFQWLQEIDNRHDSEEGNGDLMCDYRSPLEMWRYAIGQVLFREVYPRTNTTQRRWEAILKQLAIQGQIVLPEMGKGHKTLSDGVRKAVVAEAPACEPAKPGEAKGEGPECEEGNSTPPFDFEMQRREYATRTDPPFIIFMGGGMGAGKSSIRGRIGDLPVVKKYGRGMVVLDPDQVKQSDPLFERFNEKGQDAGTQVHKSSIDLTYQCFLDSVNDGRDILLDGTMMWRPFVEQTVAMVRSRKRHKMGRGYVEMENGEALEEYWVPLETGGERDVFHRMPEFKGYRLYMFGLTVSPEVAIRRGITRALTTGRTVPADRQLESFKMFAKNFLTYVELFDECRLFVNSPHDNYGEPKLIAQCHELGGHFHTPYLKRFNAFKRQRSLRSEARCQAELWHEPRAHKDDPNHIIHAPCTTHHAHSDKQIQSVLEVQSDKRAELVCAVGASAVEHLVTSISAPLMEE